MQRFIIFTITSLILFIVVSSVVYADPTLPLPRMPIAGDQDGSETPLILRAPSFDLVTDVQNFRVPGDGAVEIAFDFVFREAGYNDEFGFFRVDNPSGEINNLSLFVRIQPRFSLRLALTTCVSLPRRSVTGSSR